MGVRLLLVRPRPALGVEPLRPQVGVASSSAPAAPELVALQLVEDHGVDLLRVASVVSDDRELAVRVVAEVIVAVALDGSRPAGWVPTRAELSRLTVWSCARATLTAGDHAPPGSAGGEVADAPGCARLCGPSPSGSELFLL